MNVSMGPSALAGHGLAAGGALATRQSRPHGGHPESAMHQSYDPKEWSSIADAGFSNACRRRGSLLICYGPTQIKAMPTCSCLFAVLPLPACRGVVRMLRISRIMCLHTNNAPAFALLCLCLPMTEIAALDITKHDV